MHDILGPQMEELDLFIDSDGGLLDIRSCHKLKKLKIRFTELRHPIKISVREREVMTVRGDGCECLYPDLNSFEYDICHDADEDDTDFDGMIMNLISSCSYHHMKIISIISYACLTHMKLSIPVDYVNIDDGVSSLI